MATDLHKASASSQAPSRKRSLFCLGLFGQDAAFCVTELRTAYTACEQLQYADKSPHQIEGGTKQAGTDSTWRAKEARFMQSVEG